MGGMGLSNPRLRSGSERQDVGVRLIDLVKSLDRRDRILLVLLCLISYFVIMAIIGIFAPLLLEKISRILDGYITYGLLILLSIEILFWAIEQYDKTKQFEGEQKARGLVKYKDRWGTPREVEEWREKDRYEALPTITEIRCTCNQCGKVWHYLPSEKKEAEPEPGCGGCVTCSGCLLLSPLLAILGLILGSSEKAEYQAKRMALKKVNECPNCHSKDFDKEEITYKKDE